MQCGGLRLVSADTTLRSMPSSGEIKSVTAQTCNDNTQRIKDDMKGVTMIQGI